MDIISLGCQTTTVVAPLLLIYQVSQIAFLGPCAKSPGQA